MGKTISVRLDDKTVERLDELQRVRGVSTSEIIRKCINEIPILQIGNVSDLSQEFYKIRIALENGEHDEVRTEANKLCRCMLELLAKIEGTLESENV